MKPLKPYLKVLVAGLLLLTVSVAAWLVWSNSPTGSVATAKPSLARTGGFVSSGHKLKTVQNPVVGEVFTTNNGSWSKAVSSFTYLWRDCTGVAANGLGTGCSTASGSPTNTTSYTAVSGDVGSNLDVRVTANFTTGGSASQSSLATGVVASGGGSSVVAATPNVPTTGTGSVTLPGGETWDVAFADGFGTTNFVDGSHNTNDSSGCSTGGTCRDAAFRINWGQGTTLHQGSNPGSEVEAFSSAQTSVQSDGLHNQSKYTPHVNSTLCTQSGGCNYTSGEIATDYSTGFHWNAGGGAIWVLEANIKWAPQFDGGPVNGGNDDALWGGLSGADEYDTPEHFGYGGGIAPPGTGACSGCTFNTGHMASTGGGIGCVSPQCTPCGSGHTQQCTETAYKWFNSSGSPSYGGGYSYSEFCNCDPAAAFHTYDWVVFADGHFGMYMDGVWAGTMSTATPFTGWQYMIFFYASRCVVAGCLPNGFTGFQGGGGTSSRDLTMRSVAMYVDSAHDNGTNVQNGRIAPGTTIGSAPVNTGTPAITGVTDISSYVAPQLVSTSGTWSGSPTSYTLQWKDCNSSGANCQNAQGASYGPGASDSHCTTSAVLDGCSYNLTASEFSACPAPGGSGVCDIKLVVTATNGSGSTPVTVDAGTVTNVNSSSPWPNYSNTGYQNTPANYNGLGNQSYATGTGGTQGVIDASKLTIASSGSATCPTTVLSNHTYSFCSYSGGLNVGSGVGHVSNVHFVGDLFTAGLTVTGGTYQGPNAITVYCDSGCTFDYDTFTPTGMTVPDLPMPQHTTLKGESGGIAASPVGHGTTYQNGYGSVCGCGWNGGVATGITFNHSDLWGWGSGIIWGNKTDSTVSSVRDSWLHDQADCALEKIQIGLCTEHTDGIGMVDTGNTVDFLTVNHNNMPFTEGNTNNIAFQSGTYNQVTVTNNVISGDGNTVAIWATSTNTTFTGNVWTNYAQQGGSINYGQSFWTQPGSTWLHNKFAWDPTGISPYYQNGPTNGPPGSTPATVADNGKCWVPPVSGNSLSTTDFGGGTC